MKKLSYCVIILLLASNLLFSQVGINTDGSVPDNSALLDVKSTNNRVVANATTLFQVREFKVPNKPKT